MKTELSVGDCVYTIHPLFEDITKMRVTQIIVDMTKRSTTVSYYGSKYPSGTMVSAIENWYRTEEQAHEALAASKAAKAEALRAQRREQIAMLEAELWHLKELERLDR